MLRAVTNGLRVAQSGSVRHKNSTKTKKYYVQAVRFMQKYSGLKYLTYVNACAAAICELL